jgi:hypothetical protein
VLKKLLVTVIAAGAMTVPLAGVAGADPPTDPAKPASPSGYGERISSIASDPEHVLGPTRSGIASSGPGELSGFVQGRRQLEGSIPNPPGKP